MALAVALTLLGACTAAEPAPPPDLGPGAEADPSGAALTWTTLPRAPSARTEVAATAAGGRIYVIGGFTADGTTVATVEVLDTAGRTWSRGPDLPVAVNHAMAASIGDSVYVFGGYRAGNQPSAAAFRLEGGGWRALAPLPQGLAAGAAGVVDGIVHLAGGIVTGGGLADAMVRYDPAADRWSTAPGPPTPREHLGGAAYGGRFYTVGGRTGGLAGNGKDSASAPQGGTPDRIQADLDAFEVFDPATGAWSRLPALPTRRGGLAAAATCAGRIIAVGGEAAATFAEVEAYDVSTGTWRRLPALPTPRHGLGVVAIGSTLYTLAGGPHPGLHVADATEVLDTTALGPCR